MKYDEFQLYLKRITSMALDSEIQGEQGDTGDVFGAERFEIGNFCSVEKLYMPPLLAICLFGALD